MNTVEQRAAMLGEYIIDRQATVRDAAKRFGISKSTVHKDVTDRLRGANPSLYAAVREVLEKNHQTARDVLIFGHHFLYNRSIGNRGGRVYVQFLSVCFCGLRGGRLGVVHSLRSQKAAVGAASAASSEPLAAVRQKTAHGGV